MLKCVRHWQAPRTGAPATAGEAASSTEVPEIAVGARLPDATFFTMDAEGKVSLGHGGTKRRWLLT